MESSSVPCMSLVSFLFNLDFGVAGDSMAWWMPGSLVCLASWVCLGSLCGCPYFDALGVYLSSTLVSTVWNKWFDVLCL